MTLTVVRGGVIAPSTFINQDSDIFNGVIFDDGTIKIGIKYPYHFKEYGANLFIKSFKGRGILVDPSLITTYDTKSKVISYLSNYYDNKRYEFGVVGAGSIYTPITINLSEVFDYNSHLKVIIGGLDYKYVSSGPKDAEYTVSGGNIVLWSAKPFQGRKIEIYEN